MTRSQRRRIEKLEPAAATRWKEVWDDVFEVPEVIPFMDELDAYLTLNEGMNEQERAELQERVLADHEQYPALLAWDDEAFVAWAWEFERWMGRVGFTRDAPSLSVWPWMAPLPPEVPESVVGALIVAAGRSGDLAGFYAHLLFQVSTARRLRQRIHEQQPEA